MMITISFLFKKLIVLHDRQGTLFTTTIEKDENIDRIFTAEDGLQFAIGIIDFDTDDFEDNLGRELEDYLTLSVY